MSEAMLEKLGKLLSCYIRCEGMKASNAQFPDSRPFACFDFFQLAGEAERVVEMELALADRAGLLSDEERNELRN